MRLGFQLLIVLLVVSAAHARQQQPPDVPTLLHEAEAHQAQMEKVRENYTFTERSVTTELNLGHHRAE